MSDHHLGGLSAGQTHNEDVGWIKGMLSEHLLRMDRFELKQETINTKLLELISTMTAQTSRDALMAGLIGACTGAITGAMAAAIVVVYLVPLLI